MFKGSRIKVLCYGPHLRAGGSERVMVNLVNSLDPDSFRPYLALVRGDGMLEKDIVPQVDLINLERSRSLLAAKPLSGVINEISPDILFFMKGYLIPSVAMAQRLSKVDTVTVYREVVHLSSDLEQRGVLGGRVKQLFLSFMYKAVDKIVAPSGGIKEDLNERFGLDKNKISVINNPFDIDFIRKQAQGSVEHSWVDSQTPLIIAVGRLVRQKGYEFLLRSVEKVLTEIDVNLLILGEGERRGSLIDLSKRLSIHDNVDFVGEKKNPFKYIASSDLFVLSSRFEGFPNTLVEAMACGAAVISTDCPTGPSEIITDGKDGYLVPFGDEKTLSDKILEVLNSEDIRIKLSKNARKKAEKFHIDRIIKEYESLFRSAFACRNEL